MSAFYGRPMTEDEARRLLSSENKTQENYLDRLRAGRRLEAVTSEEERARNHAWMLERHKQTLSGIREPRP